MDVAKESLSLGICYLLSYPYPCGGLTPMFVLAALIELRELITTINKRGA